MVGKFNYPIFIIVDMLGDNNVLLDKISLVLLPINVSLEVGSNNIPVLFIDDILGVINVLLVKDYCEFKETRVSVVFGIVIILLIDGYIC
jgi:hypothetical protein